MGVYIPERPERGELARMFERRCYGESEPPPKPKYKREKLPTPTRADILAELDNAFQHHPGGSGDDEETAAVWAVYHRLRELVDAAYPPMGAPGIQVLVSGGSLSESEVAEIRGMLDGSNPAKFVVLSGGNGPRVVHVKPLPVIKSINLEFSAAVTVTDSQDHGKAS